MVGFAKKYSVRLLFSAVLLVATVFVVAAQEAPLEVRGRVIDIRTAERSAEVYPQHRRLHFGKSMPVSVEGLRYAVSLLEFDGPSQVRTDSECDLLAAVCRAVPDPRIWTPTGERFRVDTFEYRLYHAHYDLAGRWMELPKPGEGGASTMLFARELTVADTEPVPGVVVARVKNLRKMHITNPNILILDDGSYLVSGTNVERGRGTEFYRSTDRGETWEHWSEGFYPINFFSLFEHRGALYMIGTRSPEGYLVICRSDDGGRHWTFPADEFDRGVILRGHYHSAPVPTIVRDGRIWRAVETNFKDERRRAFFISAPVDADLMKASSWTKSREMASDAKWRTMSDGGEFRQWIEGNAVAAPDGTIVNLLRVDEHTEGRTAAIVTLKGRRKLEFDPAKDIIEMPGGGKKFTVRYDSVSRRYWALVNPVREEFKGMSHRGWYAGGIHCGLIRNTLTLISSDDLRNWREERDVICSDNPFFDGFQYVDWQFDGDDIVAVIRLAMEEPRGLPTRQHDANFLVFKRVERFRFAGTPDIVHTLNKTFDND